MTTPDSAKVLVCLNHGVEDPENVLIAYLVGVESLRAGKQALMFLTKDGIHLATPGFADKIDVPGHRQSRHSTRNTSTKAAGSCMPGLREDPRMQDADWVPNTEVAGMPSVLEYTTGGALVFNY